MRIACSCLSSDYPLACTPGDQELSESHSNMASTSIAITVTVTAALTVTRKVTVTCVSYMCQLHTRCGLHAHALRPTPRHKLFTFTFTPADRFPTRPSKHAQFSTSLQRRTCLLTHAHAHACPARPARMPSKEPVTATSTRSPQTPPPRGTAPAPLLPKPPCIRAGPALLRTRCEHKSRGGAAAPACMAGGVHPEQTVSSPAGRYSGRYSRSRSTQRHPPHSSGQRT